MSVELISVLVAVLAIRGDLGRADPDQQSRVAAGHYGKAWRDWSLGWMSGSMGWRFRFDAMEKQFGELRERMAHLGGLLEGLREAVGGRAKARRRKGFPPPPPVAGRRTNMTSPSATAV